LIDAVSREERFFRLIAHYRTVPTELQLANVAFNAMSINQRAFPAIFSCHVSSAIDARSGGLEEMHHNLSFWCFIAILL